MRMLAFVPGGMLPAAVLWRSRAGQRLLWWFLAKNPPGPDIGESYFGPAVRDRGIRRDLAKFVRGAFVPEDQPALLAEMIASFVSESFREPQGGGAHAGAVA